MKWGLKGVISVDADSGPLGYVLWCCGSKSCEVFIYFQIGSGNTVGPDFGRIDHRMFRSLWIE